MGLRCIKLYLFMLYYITSCRTGQGEIISTDTPYDIIDFKVPRVIWNQALNPTPVLKSPVTIVVPVHLNDEEDIADDEEIEDEIIDENEIINPDGPEVPLVQEIANDTQTIANTTQQSVIEDPTTTIAPDVTGQVVRYPCSCPDGQCGCCTGAFLDRINMKACGNISFIPEDFVFDVRLSVNNNTVVRRRVSASDPPPICFNPRRAPFVQVCAEISNIRIRNRNAFACLDINANIGGFQIYSASFRCFGLGQSGVQTGLKPKPVKTKGPKPVSLYGNSDNDDDRDSLLDTVAGGILGGGEGGFFGGGGSDDDGGDGDGPFDGIGDAIGDFFDGRKMGKILNRL